MNKSKFFLFNMKIRSKLISIVSLIIIISLSSMIFLATFFFNGEIDGRVNENNLKLSGILSLKVKADLTAIVEKLNLMGTTMIQQFKTAQQKNLFTDLFFSNDKDYIYAVIAGKAGEKSLYYNQSIYNKEFLRENEFNTNEIEKIIDANSPSFIQTFNDEAVVQNVSDSFKMPVVGIAIPFKRDASGNVNSIVIGFLKLDRFLQAFQSEDIVKSYMINNNGDIIAHPDSKIVLSRGNYMNLPIVKKMITSKIDNGQSKYDFKDITYIGSFKKIGFAGIGVISTVEEDKAFEAVYNIQYRNVIIMIIVLNLAILVVYFFGKTLTSPIITLLGATKKIEQGEFIVDIVPTTRDEIGDLTSSFISMGQGLEEREKMKDAFGKFVNPTIAEQVLKGEISLGGERKDACVFFSDIRSFTAISEKLEPEEVVEFLNQYMTRMVNCVNKTDGVVDKFIGDAIMAIWGAPISTGKDTENAINASLMMRKELQDFNKDRGGDKRPIIKIGSGINTGPVLAGQIGSDQKMEYTVIGDTVNLASRVEALNKPFGTDILISADSYERVKDLYNVEPMQTIKVKGKSEPQQIYAVIGRKDDPSDPKTMEEVREIIQMQPQDFSRRSSDSEEGETKYEIIDDPKSK